MSSLRNAVKRIAHKERSQPTKRQHLGILQKKKDYKKRADDYHRKTDRINRMKQKAAMRNPDEFYFGMNTSSMKAGKHKNESDYTNLPPEMIKLMKDQDLSYIRMQRQKDAKKAERLQTSLHLLTSQAEEEDQKPKRKHTVFVNDKESAENFDVTDHFDTIPELAGRTFNRLRRQDVERLAKDSTTTYDENGEDYQMTSRELEKQAKIEKKIAKRLAKARASAYGEMEARINRAKAMQNAEDQLITEKNVASKGRKRKIKEAEDGRPAQYKWRRKRLG